MEITDDLRRSIYDHPQKVVKLDESVKPTQEYVKVGLNKLKDAKFLIVISAILVFTGHLAMSLLVTMPFSSILSNSIKPGPQVGATLNQLFDLQVSGKDSYNLQRLAKKYARERK